MQSSLPSISCDSCAFEHQGLSDITLSGSLSVANLVASNLSIFVQLKEVAASESQYSRKHKIIGRNNISSLGPVLRIITWIHSVRENTKQSVQSFITKLSGNHSKMVLSFQNPQRGNGRLCLWAVHLIYFMNDTTRQKSQESFWRKARGQRHVDEAVNRC